MKILNGGCLRQHGEQLPGDSDGGVGILPGDQQPITHDIGFPVATLL